MIVLSSFSHISPSCIVIGCCITMCVFQDSQEQGGRVTRCGCTSFLLAHFTLSWKRYSSFLCTTEKLPIVSTHFMISLHSPYEELPKKKQKNKSMLNLQIEEAKKALGSMDYSFFCHIVSFLKINNKVATIGKNSVTRCSV